MLKAICWLAVLSMFVALPAAAQFSLVSGTVDAPGGLVSGITVAAYNAEGQLVVTTNSDVQGRYTLALPTGTYRLLAYDLRGTWATSFYSNASSFETSARLPLTQFESVNGVNFHLVQGIQVSGRVTVGATPLSGMVVAAYNLDGTRRGFERTRADGSYSLVLPAGQYKFVTYDDNQNYATEFYSGQTSFQSAQVVSVTGPIPPISFNVTFGARVTGRVLDRESALPVSSVDVTAYDLAGNLVTSVTPDSTGRFSLALPPGTYKFVAADPAKHYQVSFFRDANSFASAASFNLAAGSFQSNVDFSLSPVPNQSREAIFVSAAANAQGGNGTFFRTDVWIFNPSDSNANVTITFLVAGRDNRDAQGRSINVLPQQQVALSNILQTVFELSSMTGALKFESEQRIRVTSRTYNVPPDSTVTGTFGLSIPGLPLSSSIGRGLIAGLSNNDTSRTNVGVLNPQPNPITVTFKLFRADGTLLAEGSKGFAPLEWFQANTIFSFLGVTQPIDNAYLRIESTEGSFFSYGSVVDQKSGDGTIILATAE